MQGLFSFLGEQFSNMSQPAKDIVVTGVGVCCHMGDDLHQILSDLRAGHNHPFTTYPDAVKYGTRCQLIGMYPGKLSLEELGASKQQARFMGRASLMAIKAAQIALEESGIDPSMMAVVVGSGTGDVETHQEIADKLKTIGNARRVAPTVIPRLMASTVSANLATFFESRGPSFSATAACAGGPYNMAIAAGWIEHGLVEAALVGGVEVVDIHFYAGFDSMRAYNGQDNDQPQRASRPYAADRAGFIFSEGAGIVILEARETAEKRGAEILGVLRGYGMSSDGTGQMVAPSADGALAAMKQAVSRAGINIQDIDYVNTHATSTPLGDASEIRALRRLFQDIKVRYSSTKGYTGHPVSAAGTIEAIFTWAMLREGWIAPSVNARPLDPELEDYPPILEPTNTSLKMALSNSFGFGGTNACLVLEAP